MRGTIYNNPMFGQAMGGAIADLFPDPRDTAAAELAAAQAGMVNDTRGYRQAIGTAGQGGDLAGMMVAALQAGRDYSTEAPEIASALGSLPGVMGDRDLARLMMGTGVANAPQSVLADMLGMAAFGGGGGGRSGGGGGRRRASTPSAPKPTTPRDFTASGRAALIKGLGEDVDPATALAIAAQAEGLLSDPSMTENQAIAYALSNLERGPDVVTNPGGTMVSRSVADLFGGDSAQWAPDEAVPGPVSGIRKPAAADPLAEARDAIAQGAPREAVIARLKEMGIDPGGL